MVCLSDDGLCLSEGGGVLWLLGCFLPLPRQTDFGETKRDINFPNSMGIKFNIKI